jgi:YhcH/YjgK/YiaL family protein
MILDMLQNHRLYCGLGARFEPAFTALADGIAHRADGTYELAGADVRAIVQRYQTRPIEKCVWEAHRKFIDVQYIDSGAEQIGWIPTDQVTVRDPYNAEKDVEFFNGDDGEFFTLSAGMFAIFFPTDAHRPCVQIDQSGSVLKVVVKIAL